MTSRRDLRPVLLVAILVTLLAAARALEPDGGKAGSFVLEVGGALTIGLLIISTSRGAGVAKEILAARQDGSVPEIGRECLALGSDCALVVLLAVPGLVAGWELGGTGSELLSVASGILAACVTGAALGFLLAIGKLPLPAATLVAASATALTLWPATLGWTGSLRAGFPAPEFPAVVLLVSATSVLAGGVTLTARLRRVR